MKLAGLWLIAESANWYLPHENICWISERPSIINLDENNRIHSEKEPSIAYPSGFEIYGWHGVRVSKEIITKPIRIKQIDKEENAEIRRVMVEKYGVENYLKDSGAKIISKDNSGELLYKDMGRDEAIVMVKVKNSTPEPDGHFKDYFLRVPPDIKTASEAVAWTFGMNKEEYKPLVET